MHTLEYESLTFIHNGDYSGDIHIIGKDEDGNDVQIETARMSDIVSFVGDHIRDDLISSIEDLDMSNPEDFIAMMQLFKR